MAIANGLSLPNPLSNGTTADAVAVMSDYNYLLSALNRALLDSGGGAGMNAQSTQIHNLANATSANDAVNLSQLGSYALLAGAAFTGAVSIAATLGVTGATTLAALAATTLAASGNATVGGTLGVTGNTTLGGTLGVTGALTATGLITGSGGFAAPTITLNGSGVDGGAIINPRDGTTGFTLLYSSTAYTFAIWSNGADRIQVTAAGNVIVPGALSANGLSLTNPLPVASGGSGTASATGTGSLVLSGSPAFTGAPTAPTTGTGDSSTKLATTAYVQANASILKSVPSITQTANYTLALTDVGGAVNMNGAGLTLTIPANASIAIPVDSVILVTNLNASNLSIAITSDTLTFSGTTTTGTRTLGQNGEARLRKVSATSWLVTGTALS